MIIKGHFPQKMVPNGLWNVIWVIASSNTFLNSYFFQGTYADDCLVNRVTQHKAYIVATCDKDLKRRIRKIPGVPIMYLTNHRYSIERMPDAYGAPKDR